MLDGIGFRLVGNGDCEDCEAGITQHSAEIINLNSEKRKAKGSGFPELIDRLGVDTDRSFSSWQGR